MQACLAATLLALAGCSSAPLHDREDAQAAAKEPLPPEYEKALSLMRSGDYGAAIPALQAFSAARPELAGPYINLGIALSRMGDSDAALKALKKATELNPDNPVSYLESGILYRNKGDFQAALQAYQRALTLKPDYALAHCDIGILYDLYLQEPDKALAHYKRYLELTGDEDKTVKGWVVDLQRRIKPAQASAKP